MTEYVTVTWGIHDGYAGGSRPQTTLIDKSFFDGLTEEDKYELIDDMVRQDMEALGFFITDVDWGEDDAISSSSD